MESKSSKEERIVIEWRLKEVMDANGITNRRLARKMGRATNTIRGWRLSSRMKAIDSEELAALCTALTMVLREKKDSSEVIKPIQIEDLLVSRWTRS